MPGGGGGDDGHHECRLKWVQQWEQEDCEERLLEQEAYRELRKERSRSLGASHSDSRPPGLAEG